MSKHQEAQQLRIDLSDETADHFAQFVDYLYKPKWEPTCKLASDLVYLAELYAMGERLVAQAFQDIVLRTFRNNITRITLPQAELLTLLGIACGNITERFHPRDDPMRDVILWFVSTRLTELRAAEGFLQILTECRELGTQLILRAGNASTQMPSDPFVARENDPFLQRKAKKDKKSAGWG